MKNILLFFVLFSTVCLWAQVPQTIDYQGRLADNDGNYLNGVVTVSFIIYDAETAGTAIWSETQDVDCVNGIFHVQLGSVTSIAGTFDGSDRWLELTVGAETLTPRTAIASVPYSIKAEDANLLNGLNSSDFMPATEDNWVNITGDTMGGPLIVQNYVRIASSDPIRPLTVNSLVGTNPIQWQVYSSPVGELGSNSMGAGNIYLYDYGPVCAVKLTANGNSYLNGGNVGIGTDTPASKLTVAGTIESTSDGYKFPDGTTQTSASFGDITAVTAGTGLNGGGTSGAVSLNVNVPLVLSGSDYVINATTTGPSSYAIKGENSAVGNYAKLGDDEYGVFANLLSTIPGNYAIYGYGTDSSGEDGTNYSAWGTLGGVRGYNYFGNPYTFGVAGYSWLDFNRSGGLIGAQRAGYIWGSLGYRNSGGTAYGAYWTSSGSGSGDYLPAINIGMGSWGDLFGADIHGRVYGTFTEGDNYALYSSGTVFKNDLDVHLQKTESNEMNVLYTNVSTDVTVQTSGYATLSAGRCEITFDDNFSSIVSDDIPIVVTVSPLGQSEGVFVSQVNKNGFSIVENNNARSNVKVSFIAVGRRVGYENPQLPAEVIAADYTDKIAEGLHNDADMDSDGKGLYYENNQLNVGRHPSTLPDKNKPAPPEE